jgi:Fe-Mn family superoxide dismutase
MVTTSRRRFVAGGVLLAGSVVAAEILAATPPKETGLSSEGLLAGRPGFQPRTVMPLAYPELPGFLSKGQLDRSYAAYVDDVRRLAETERRLRDSIPDAAQYGALRRTQVAAANNVLLHELDFRNLAAQPVAVPGYVERHMREHIGSIEDWAADFTRCALAAKAWAALVYDPYDDRWHDVVMDGGDSGVWIGANPLVVCDVSEHAFGTDYGRREDYVAKFLQHVDWNEVASRYKATDRM